MMTLALQIFLLLLSAFLAGCMLGCVLRRMFHDSRAIPEAENMAATAAATAVPAPVTRPTTPEAARFERALTGRDAPVTTNARSEPVVEVRPRSPAPAPVSTEPAKAAPASIEIVKAAPVEAKPTQVAEAKPTQVAEAKPTQVAEAKPTPIVEAKPTPVVEAKPAPVVLSPPDRQTVVPASAPRAPAPAPPPPAPAPAPAAASPVPAYVPSDAPAPTPLAPSGYRLTLPEEPKPAPKPAPAPASQTPAAAAPPTVPAAPEKPAVSEEAAKAASYAAIAAASAAAGAIAAGAARAESKAAAPGPADDLKRIRGIDTALEARLNAAGVRRYADVAGWSKDDVARMNQALGLVGRIEHENWIEQAQILARGGETDYSRRQRLSASTAAASAAAAATAAASAMASATAQASAGPDRLTRIIGIDAPTEAALIGMGVTRYIDIARWSSADIERVERDLNLPGRVGLDNWVEQARVLARYAGETDAAPRPVRLADAIRENKETAAKTASAAAPRGDLAGLRSVRSEVLRGEPPLAGDRADDLKRIRGVGVLIEKRLNSLGIVSYEQIANWTGADIDRISTTLDFKGRIERENWIEQARILASGGQTEFSRRVDRGEVDSSRES